MAYGLSPETITQLQKVFSQYSHVSEVILYGSRAKGNYTEGSDIDLTLKGKNIATADLNTITNEIDKLLLPYMFDISIFSTIKNKDLIDHIKRVGKCIYRK